jgi:hypothetical protein
MVNIGASYAGIDQQSERLKWILLFLSRAPLGISGEGLLDPIRITAESASPLLPP